MATIIEGDCQKHLMAMDDKSIDIIIADPPYASFRQQAQGGRFNKYGGARDWNYRPDNVVFDEMLRVGKYVIIWGATNFASILPDSTCWVVWNKVGIPVRFSLSKTELAWTNLPSNRHCYVECSSKRSKLWNTNHPTAKPLELYTQLLDEIMTRLKCELHDMKFLDPFLGAGLSLIAAESYGMNAIGIELNPDYVAMAKENQKIKIIKGLCPSK
jgi:DNA modification methylase